MPETVDHLKGSDAFMYEASRLMVADAEDTDHAVALAVESLRHGGVVLLPTDTVYGLVCLPTSSDAVERIYAMKKRSPERRLPIIVADLEQGVRTLPLHWTSPARALALAFWPGALTIACGVQQQAEGWLRGRDEAAVRVPKNTVVQTLARALGPMLMTSANLHGVATPHTMEGALSVLAIPPSVALDGGEQSGIPSTLVNVNLARPVVEREGAVSAIEIEQVLSAT